MSALRGDGKLSFQLAGPSSEQFGPRCGTLSLAGSENVLTPALVASTSRGAVPHVTRDVLNDRLPGVAGVHLAFEHFAESGEPAYIHAPFSIRRYIGLSDQLPRRKLLTLGARDPMDRSTLGANGRSFVAVRSHRGAKTLEASAFERYALARPPDILFAMADEPTHPEPGSARLKSSVDRSLGWLLSLLDSSHDSTNVFATLVGSPNSVLAEAYSRELVSPTPYIPSSSLAVSGEPMTPMVDRVFGFSFPLTLLRNSTSFIDRPDVLAGRNPPILPLLKAALGPLPSSKPRAVTGARGPHEMLRLVRDVGVDIFVDGWTSDLSTVGVALDFDFPIEPGHRRDDIGVNLFEDRFADDFGGLSTSDLAADPALEETESPPSRAYLHHLLHSHEMTAHVLLTIHNHLVITAFLSRIRAAIVSDSFASQYDAFFATYPEVVDGEYPCLVSARRDHAKVESERGKGRDKRKARPGPGTGTPLDEVESMSLADQTV